MSGPATFLSGYRLMWILVMFDLPTDTKRQRKAAGDFRNFLLDEGFERSQFSIYARFINGKEAFETRIRRIERALPAYGDVQILLAVRTLKDRGSIVVIMAHRPAALAECDLVLVMRNGQVAAFGPRDEVLKAQVANHARLVSPQPAAVRN